MNQRSNGDGDRDSGNRLVGGSLLLCIADLREHVRVGRQQGFVVRRENIRVRAVRAVAEREVLRPLARAEPFRLGLCGSEFHGFEARPLAVRGEWGQQPR